MVLGPKELLGCSGDWSRRVETCVPRGGLNGAASSSFSSWASDRGERLPMKCLSRPIRIQFAPIRELPIAERLRHCLPLH